MKISKKIIPIIILCLLLIIIFSVYIFNKNNYSFNLNSENKYKIETDMRWITMQNDGGSHTNIYYEVDLDNKVVSKFEERYQANLGGKPKINKNKIYEKKIDDKLQNHIKILFNEIIIKPDVNEPKNDNFFTIYTSNNEKNIYNKETIQKITEVLDLIDKF